MKVRTVGDAPHGGSERHATPGQAAAPVAVVAMCASADRMEVVGALQHGGWVVDVADDGWELLETLQRLAASGPSPDAVVLELGLSGRFGSQVLQGIQEAVPGVPVVLVTPEGARATGGAGVVGQVRGPFRSDEVVDVLERALARG